MGRVVKATAPPLYTRERNTVPTAQQDRWHRADLDWCWKFPNPPGFDSRTVQPVASSCIDCAIPSDTINYTKLPLSCVWPSGFIDGNALMHVTTCITYRILLSSIGCNNAFSQSSRVYSSFIVKYVITKLEESKFFHREIKKHCFNNNSLPLSAKCWPVFYNYWLHKYQSTQNTVRMIKNGEIVEARSTHECYENYILCRRTLSKGTTWNI
jgi:hypothetical protein